MSTTQNQLDQQVQTTKLAALAESTEWLEILWLYGSRAQGNYRPTSD